MVIDRRNIICDRQKALSNGHHDCQYLDATATIIVSSLKWLIKVRNNKLDKIFTWNNNSVGWWICINNLSLGNTSDVIFQNFITAKAIIFSHGFLVRLSRHILEDVPTVVTLCILMFYPDPETSNINLKKWLPFHL